jgi:hypothetical protein
VLGDDLGCAHLCGGGCDLWFVVRERAILLKKCGCAREDSVFGD